MLVGCQLPGISDQDFQYTMAELQALAETANTFVKHIFSQKRNRIHPATFIGKGKLDEISRCLTDDAIDVVIFNDELSPGQLRNLSDLLDVKVIDRTQLILDIFAARARSKEGQLQVELAQLKYLYPRLVGKGSALSRLGGGIGTRGPGETQLETDRRHIQNRIRQLENELQNVVRHRSLYKERRKRNDSFQVSLIGYTNAGKSTLFNRLTQSDSLAENHLFATLDPLTRKLPLFPQYDVLLTDTVGFIQKLPTQLIAAFRATLEEISEADLILHVIDGSHENFHQHEKTVRELLIELGADHIPEMTIYNKKDAANEPLYSTAKDDSLVISAFDENDIVKLKTLIKEHVKQQFIPYTVHVPLSNGKLLAQLSTKTILTNKRWLADELAFSMSGYAPESMAHIIETNSSDQQS